MGFFNNFPYTNFHELNLDWILDRIRKLQYDMEAFVVSNILKYADPIGWDITKEYEANTIVSYGDKTYLSKKPVPAGIAITNPDYWFEVGDLSTYSLQLEEIRLQIADSDEGINAAAVNNYSAGELFWLNGYLCEALTAITIGDPFAEGSNYKKVTVEELLGRYTLRTDFDTLDNTVTAALSDITALQTGLAENINHRIKNHFRIYVDGVNGDDETGDGTQGTPYKTLMKALSFTNIYTEVRITILTSGTYYIDENLAASASVHITANVANVVILLSLDTGGAFAVYASHWNLQGLSDSDRMTITVDPLYLNNAYMYFDCSLVTLSNVNIEIPCNLYGSSLSASNATFKTLHAEMAFLNLNAIGTSNTSPTENGFFFNACHGRWIGGAGAVELTAQGVDNAYIFLRNCFFIIGNVMPTPTLTNSYGYAIKLDYGTILNMTFSRYTTSLARGTNTGGGMENGSYLCTEGGIAGRFMCRYNTTNSKMQHWDNTSNNWVDN